MKQNLPLPALSSLLMLVVLLSSCSAIEGVFKVGMWTGILVVVVIIAVVIWIITRMGRRG